MSLREYILQDKIFNLERLESYLYSIGEDMKYIEVHDMIGKLKMKLFDYQFKNNS